MKKCLLLAFEDAKDFKKELEQFDRIDAYGPLAKVNITKFKKLHIFKQFFWIENYKMTKEKYDLCIIRHPDIWGEPINWVRAIAAIAESVRGKLVCEFWMPSEIIAFDFFLTSIIGDNIKFERIYKSFNRTQGVSNFIVEWRILKTREGMLSFYRNNKLKIMHEFYQSVGPIYWKLSFNSALGMLKRKYA